MPVTFLQITLIKSKDLLDNMSLDFCLGKSMCCRQMLSNK